jgi:hypothetical protein
MSNSNAQKLSDNVIKVFNATQKVVDGLADGQRKQIKDLVTDVAGTTNMSANEILGFVSYFAHNIEPEAHVRRGKLGGLVKGARKVSLPKKPKAVKVVAVADEPVAADAN